MDNLPSLLLTKILSYLPGNDVSRFAQLNSMFRNEIKQNRKYLKKPLIWVEIYNNNGDQNEEVTVLVYSRHKKIGKNHFKFYPKPAEWLNEDQIDYTDYNDNFFETLRTAEDSVIPDRLAFDLMLEKADIEELSVTNLVSSDCICDLTDAIKASSCRIYSVLSSPVLSNDDEGFQLLEAIANQKEKVKPRLRIGTCSFCNELCRGYDKVTNIHKLNEISSMFHSARFEIATANTPGLILTIGMQWNTNPFPTFYFDIQSFGRVGDIFHPAATKLYDKFDGEVVSKNEQYFLYIAPEDEESSVTLIDKENGNRIQFNKKNGELSYFYSHEAATVLISIDVSIQ